MVSLWAKFESVDAYIRKNGFVTSEVHRLVRVFLPCSENHTSKQVF